MTRTAAVLLLVLACALQAEAQQQDTRRAVGLAFTDTLRFNRDTLTLSHGFVQRGSLSLRIGDRALDSTAFTLDARNGVIVLAAGVRARTGPDSAARVVVSYRALPLSIQPEYRLRTLAVRRDSVRGDSVRVALPAKPMTVESIFGPDLQKSGYLGRGFTVGTNRDLTLSSGFRLQVSGKLADDVSIVGALTDENTPIQPEGNTRTIQELDKVFVKISGGNLAATLGDFVLSYGGTEFGSYNRKLSGFLGEGKSDLGEASVSYASLKGTFRTMQFNGIDGVQGPYRLTGKNGEQRILVLAGTERVYVDGVQMVRGETNDYVIEYASGEITFKPRRLITSYARITIDFEYADRQYSRTLFTANGSGGLFGDRLRVTARYMREGDDQDAPLDLSLSDGDRAVLAAAGEDAARASTSGTMWVGLDSASGKGAGQYERIDTLINGSLANFFRYNPGTDSATWSLSFSYVGSGQGAYTRKATGVYVYAGDGHGDYAPIRLLPLPQLHQTGDLLVRAKPVDNLELNAEGAVSSLDRNRFSDIRGVNNDGAALNGSMRWTPSISGAGAFDLSARFRTIAPGFTPIDRINDIEFSRKWDLTAQSGARETMREAALGWKPLPWIDLHSGAGSINNGTFASSRVDGGLTLTRDTALWRGPALAWSFESISSDDGASNTRGAWFRQKGEVSQQLGSVQPRFQLEQERRRSTAGGSDTLTANSYGFIDVRPGLQLREFWNLTLGADVGIRSEEALLDGAVRKQSTDLLQQYSLSLRQWHDLAATATVTVRDRRYTHEFLQRGSKDLQTILTRFQLRHTPFDRALSTDLLYEVSTERTSRMERQYIKMPFGQGNYVYKGDLNGNGLQDENEFEPALYDGEYVLVTVPTDQLFPVIDLRASARVQFQPSMLIASGADNILASAFRALSTETVLRVEENSSDERTADIYLLRLSRFLNDSTTLHGFQNMRQDMFLFEQSQAFSVRLRYDQSRGFSQYALANERSFKCERSVRVKAQLVREIGVQTDLAFVTDDVASTTSSNRARSIDGVNFTADLSYRPVRNVEVGFVLGAKSATDAHPTVPLDASINSQTVRTGLTFDGPGRLRIELERSEVILSGTASSFPFELTDGRAQGKNWIARTNMDYRLTTFLQATVSWLARSEGGRPFLHTLRAEVRAFF